MAWDFARQKLNNTCLPLHLVYDALDRAHCLTSNKSTPPPRTQTQACRAEDDWRKFLRGETNESSFFVVFPSKGVERGGGGEKGRFERWWYRRERERRAPEVFESVHKALAAARLAPRSHNKFVVLREGLHLLGHEGPLRLHAVDSHTSILGINLKTLPQDTTTPGTNALRHYLIPAAACP